MDGAALADLSRAFIGRVFGSDFLTPTTRPDERAALAALSPPITLAQPQDYLAWRRAALWMSGVMLAIGMIIALVDFTSAEVALVPIVAGVMGIDQHQAAAQVEQVVGRANLEVIDNYQYFTLTCKGTVAVLVLLAAWNWLGVRRSRQYVRWAWIVAVAVPLLAAAYPWVSALDFTHIEQQNAQLASAVKVGISMLFAFVTLVSLAPKLLGMFPGIMRAALTMKTLLPEASAPGWLTVVFAPLYIGFLLLPLAVVSQLEGSWTLIIAFALLAVGPTNYLRRAGDLARAHTVEEASSTVRAMRKQAVLFNVAGLGVLLYFLIDRSVMSTMTVIHIMLEGFGGVLMTMVVFADVMLALLRFGHEQERSFRDSPLEQTYAGRLLAFDQSGLGDIGTALGVGELSGLRARMRGERGQAAPPPAPPPPPAS